ncbi:MAG: mobile mystery protein A [Pseudomonadota bacterium]
MINDENLTSRRQLDRRLSPFKPTARFDPPSRGWIRAVRDALGMSGAQLGRRMDVTAQSVSDIEKSEAAGTIQLKTLRRVAEAMDCVLIYALVPRSSLEEIVQERARELAERALSGVAHTMRLESQGLSDRDHQDLIDDYIRTNIRRRDLWEND